MSRSFNINIFNTEPAPLTNLQRVFNESSAPAGTHLVVERFRLV
jgi:hypothetical protein